MKSKRILPCIIAAAISLCTTYSTVSATQTANYDPIRFQCVAVEYSFADTENPRNSFYSLELTGKFFDDQDSDYSYIAKTIWCGAPESNFTFDLSDATDFSITSNGSYTAPSNFKDIITVYYWDTSDYSINGPDISDVREASGTYKRNSSDLSRRLETSIYIMGDANQDGSLNQDDIDDVGDHVAEISVLPAGSLKFKAADINCDGIVNLLDLVCLQHYINGYPDSSNLNDVLNERNEFANFLANNY